MFESLTGKLERVFKKLRSKGVLTEKDIDAALREVRLSLLEADVNYKVVKEFISRVKEEALGKEVLESLTPAQQVIKIVHEKLVEILGGSPEPIDISPPYPSIAILAGLQGSGKTTTAAKLAKFFKEHGRKPYLVSTDVYRPAALDQLKKLADSIDVDFYEPQEREPEKIVIKARERAVEAGAQVLIVDTAGRLHIDQEMMDELKGLKELLNPKEVLLVADAMTGQDAVNVAKSFNEAVGITGVILTKMDGDARGGAALSIRFVTGRPIKFIGTGEKLDGIEPFYPDRIASRILGMGDMLSLIEKAQREFDEKKAAEVAKRIRDATFTLEDFREQLVGLKKMGGLEEIISSLPLPTKFKKVAGLGLDDKDVKKWIAIIDSMTREERRNYRIINASRKRRIARGSGTTVQDVNRLLKAYGDMVKLMKKMRKRGGITRLLRQFFG